MLSIILANPQMGENIGAAARAMLNFGLLDLRIVNPRDGWPNDRAQTTASGALDIIKPRIFDALEDAIADCHFICATTARPRDMVKPVYTPETAIEKCIKRTNENQKTAIVFGAERTGMLNEEISQCQAIITIPTNPEFSSLNLGQSVLLMAYELKKQTTTKNTDKTSKNTPAPQKDINAYIARLLDDLEDRHFFRSPDVKPTTQRNIQNIFTRADITDQELKTLHGVLSALRGNKKPPNE